jgi:hypothetical protein
MADDASSRMADDPNNEDLFLAIDIIIDTQRNEPASSSSINEDE